MSYLPTVFQILLALLVICAGVYDIRWRRVPNWLTLSGVVLGVALNTFLYETPGLWLSLKGLGVALLVYFPLYAIRAMGAGDAKLMAAIGALVGPWNWFGVFMISAVTGGVFAIALLLTTGRMHRTFANVGFMLKELAYFRPPYLANEELDVRSPKALGLPHAAMIALGSLGFLAVAAIWAPR
jgi:prepilin peptidase CpaA